MSAKFKRAAYGLAAATCAIALLWWISWCFHSLSGWTAFPLGATVGAILYGLGSLCVLAAVAVEDDPS